jgi:ubiquinone/menaquinone biosynthesis C-methylase UbiE
MEPSDARSGDRERYPLTSTAAFMMRRTADQQAQFFLPRLHAHMSLLDCGCGRGSITVGLAKIVAPGEVVGIDINANDLTYARAHAAEQGVRNVRFETADIYDLPFPDDAFDAVFSHALLEHLNDPLKALKEMQRVLKPGGVIGVRAPDFEGNLIAPPDPLVLRAEELYQRLSIHSGGNPRVGKHLRALLHESGFSDIVCSASYDCSDAPEMTRKWATTIEGLLTRKREDFIALGLADGEEMDRVSKAYKQWGEHVDAFMARAFCEAVGRAR